jgi:nucleoside-diphosphate-sugar epimerase
MKIAITGNRGFIGFHLQPILEKEGHEIIEIDLSLNRDITRWDSISDLPDFDILIHLAARIFVPDSYNFPYEFNNTNVTGTLNVLELCRQRNAKIVFISSYLYGNPKYLPIDENHPVSSFNPYAHTKLIGESLCTGYNDYFKVPAVILRPFNTYGPGQNSSFLIPSIVNQAKSGRIVLDDPDPKRDMVYISDLIYAIRQTINYNSSTFEIFNIGSGMSIAVHEIASTIVEMIDRKITVTYTGQKRAGEINDTVSDISKAQKLLKWEPKIAFRNGIKILLKHEGILIKD